MQRRTWMMMLVALAITSGWTVGLQADDKLPSARELFDKYAKAIGGADKLKAIKSRRVTGEMSMPASGIKGTLKLASKRPNLLSVTTEIPGVGTIVQAFNGTHAWEINPLTGSSLREGKELDFAKDGAFFDNELYPDSEFKSMTVEEKTKFDDQQCYKIKLVTQRGFESFVFVDTQTSLIRGMEGVQPTPQGDINVITSFSDYKDFNGLKLPTKTVQKFAAIEVILTVSAVEFDKVEDKEFEMPADIQTLVKDAEAQKKK